jgi:multiple antibiotic resistance protein
MSQHLSSFIHLVLMGFVTLLPVVDPVGTAFIISPYFSGLSRSERVTVVKKITFYAFAICSVNLFIGHWILEVFGLTIPIIQLAGGIVICKIGWSYLSSDSKDDTDVKTASAVELEHMPLIENKLFYPITFPMTTGAGTVSVLLTLSANGADKNMSLYLIGSLLVSIIGICILIFIFYLNTNRLVRYIGSHNEKIINRIMAFLTFCVGLQIAVGGIVHLIKIYS